MFKPYIFNLLFMFTVTYVVSSPEVTLGCNKRVQIARAQQHDSLGRNCWDLVTVTSCGGRCHSREISHYEFPYKKSHHPVCGLSARRYVTVALRHCDPGVTPGTEVFTYVAAEQCKCGICSSEDTSCEWLPPNSTLLKGLRDEDRLQDLYDINDALDVI